MSISVNLKAVGLNRSPNPLDVPPGSLIEASNVIIKRDSIIEPRRGYPLYGTPIGTSSDRAKQLMTYKQRILRHYSNKIEFDSDGKGTFLPFCGTFLEPQTGRRIRYIEANGNFYFTTSDGIQKISAKSAADFTTACPYITPAGGIKALDLSAMLKITPGDESSILPQDSATAYRQVWGYNDANGNLILGTPSPRAVIFNPLINLELLDFNRLLNVLDQVSDNASAPSLISDGNYSSLLSLPSTASANQLLTNLIALAEKIDTDILIADQVSVAPLQIDGASINGLIGTISFSSGNPSDYFISGDNINLTGFSASTGTINGAQVVSTIFPTFSTTGDTQTGVNQVSQVVTVADVSNSLAGTYFTINSANDVTQYYVWYNVSGNGIDPSLPGKTPIRVNILTNDVANTVATDTANAITTQAPADFSASATTNTITITNTAQGPSTDAFAGTTGFAVTTPTPGVSGNVITSIGSTSGINVGGFLHGTGIPANTYVTNIGIGNITISNNVTATNTGVTLTFDSGINFNINVTPPAVTPTGPVSTLNATINDFNYESITKPTVPDTPPTDAELVAIQTYMQAIITQLQAEPNTGTPPIISSQSQINYISPLQLTTTASVILTFTIPQGVTTSDFYQIYRSEIDQATGTQVLETDISPSDEMKLVFEGFPTTQDLANGFITVQDVTPPEFAGAFLYTNQTTGEGILQANDLPPFALDINLFKNVTFYANTRTRFRETINLLGVQQMIIDYNNSITPTITIADSTISNTYTFVTGIEESITVTTTADVAGSLAGKYFTFNSANDFDQYYVWYKVSGVGSDPALTGKIDIQVDLNTGDSANTVASKTIAALLVYINDFTISVSTDVITITNNQQGACTAPTAGTSGFTVMVVTPGRGENAAAHQVLLSTSPSPAQAVNDTALSLVNAINMNPDEIVYAYYLSTGSTVPGQILLEARTLNDNPFYIVGNDTATGQSFNPDISPDVFISAIATGSPSVITTSAAHGLVNQNQIIITNSNSTPSIDGVWTITYISPTTFSIPANVTIAGNRGALINLVDAVTADNESLQNRIYFSKILQPDAVPLVNTIDVGAADQPILRIFPLRDSLFVYKSDGLFRISGETAPFNLALFDSSCILIAADSLDVSNNLVYGWTTQGITSTSETGVNIISRPIDIDILNLATQQYTDFPTATWGIGYESDNSYTAYTVQETTDTLATIAYRYSTLTNTWTTFAKTDTCGVINPFDDKQYLGAGDTNFLEKERKDFTRYDYADREYPEQLNANQFFINQIQLEELVTPSIGTVKVGDVVVQDQTLTVYQFNTLLAMLDNDPSLNPKTYVTNNTLSPGMDPRIALDNLITQIASDTGRNSVSGHTPGSDYLAFQAINGTETITSINAGDPTVITTSSAHNLQTGRVITITGSNSTPSINGTFAVTVLTSDTFTIPVTVTVPGTTGTLSVDNEDFNDIETSYNGIIELLNSDLGVDFDTYMPIFTNTSQEAIIVSINQLNKRIILNYNLNFLVGPFTIFQAIPSLIQYAPQTFGDPLNLKHIREATIMFENKAFSVANLSFSSDLLPAFQSVPFPGTGNGIFGYTGIPTQYNNKVGLVGFGYNFFGGASNSAPFRTYVPRNLQRCRYLNCQYTHTTAREKYSITGLTLTGEVNQSSRAYR